ncbi:MAG: EI24 domain-containing protein, partial [Pseudobdellovibrionaceae bacterium]
MIRIFQALGRALLDLFHPKMLLLLFIPPVGSLILWGALGYVFWDQILIFSQFFGEKFLFVQEIPPWMMEWFSVTPSSVTTALAGILALLMILPLAILTSMLITSVVVMPVVLTFVAKKFPEIEKRGRGAFVLSTKNLIVSSIVYQVLWVLSLPLW